MQPCVKYCMHYVNLLRFNNVIPVVVFDGGRLPSKALTENERQRRRDQNREQARLKLSEGDVNGAQELCQRAVEITPMMAHEFIKVLKAESVEFVVAPYEADAQLAYLSTLSPEKGGVAAVISEDSDLLAYGCNVVMYKMDRYGNGEEARLEDIMARKTTSEGPSTSLWFGCFTPELFTGMCVLAGCDFLPSVPGIGIKRAHCLVCKYRDLARVLSSMRFDRKLVIPEGYEPAFKQANAIFHHARVYDASARKLSFLKPLPEGFVNEFNGDLDFLGPDLPPSRALAIAEGRLDPISMCAFDEPTCSEPPTAMLNLRGREPKSVRDSFNCCPNFHKEDVCLGTDEELFAMLAATPPSMSLGSPTAINSSSSLCDDVRRDSCFVAHLTSISSSRVVPKPSSSEEQGPPTACSNRFVTLSPGKKRVLPPQPNNNPFKRGRKSDDLSIGLNNVTWLFNSEIDEQFKSRKQENLRQPNSTVRVLHHANPGQLAQSRDKAHSSATMEGSVLTVNGGTKAEAAEIHCEAALVPSHAPFSKRYTNYADTSRDVTVAVGTEMVVNTQISMHSSSVKPASNAEEFSCGACIVEYGNRACGVQTVDSVEDPCSVEYGTGACGVDLVDSGANDAQLQEPVELNVRRNPAAQDLAWHVVDRTGTLQQSSDVLTASDTLPMACRENTLLSNGASDRSRTAVAPKNQPREQLKAKKEVRGSRQSAKVMTSPSTPGLLKFFQRASTLG
ncbi:hypothetical protein GOP47_0009954 [Adiantum capillus-veneris]|uniref:Exonuclease 1 n=1 Tax=Adiantum capillus-veneris TaxID=13818 RepID=A0A9D4ZHL6_ADICA|nr:hypothetical protein GOP47_0009954 [Adiantum capillus-veneris]